jgi:hypothetical protein
MDVSDVGRKERKLCHALTDLAERGVSFASAATKGCGIAKIVSAPKRFGKKFIIDGVR